MNCKELLEKRRSNIREVDALTRQNAELKSLLNQYLGDNITNAAFRVPPAQVSWYINVLNLTLTVSLVDYLLFEFSHLMH